MHAIRYFENEQFYGIKHRTTHSQMTKVGLIYLPSNTTTATVDRRH